MMLKTLFRSRPEGRHAQVLYAQAVAQARRVEFYNVLGVPDRIDARFELYTLHVMLLIDRLRAEGERGIDVGQKLFDDYVSALDDSLRELGVGDLAVAKKMRRLGEAVYGRMGAYRAAFDGHGDLDQALARNVLGEDHGDATALSAYVRSARAALTGQSYEALVKGAVWPEIRA